MRHFKKIRKTENLYTEDGYVTNKKWIFSVAWLESFKSRENRQLLNRTRSKILETVTAKLHGDSVRTIGIPNVVDVVDLKTFHVVALEETREVKGFNRGDPSKYEGVALQVNRDTFIDIEFSPALFWDSSVIVMSRKNTDPVVLVKNGCIVGMICPVNFKQ